MSTFSDIKTMIREWFVLASGLADDHVIWKEQTGPVPDKPYAALRTPKNLLRYGTSDSKQMPIVGCSSEMEKICGQRKFIVNTEIYGIEGDLGDSPMDSMTAVQNSLQKSSTVWDLKREQETVISVNAGVTPAESYQIELDCEPISIEAESYLSLNGNGYAKGAATGIFNTDFNVYKTRFKPGFTLTDGVTHYIFDATDGARYSVNKGADSLLYVRAGNSIAFYVLPGNYSGFWNELGWNELIIIVDSLGVSHSAVLNENPLTLNATGSFTPASPAEIFVGARGNITERWVGLIDYVRIYAGTTEALALANLTAGYEFANDYTGTPAPTMTAFGTGNTFTTEDVPEDIRDNFVAAINTSALLDPGIVAKNGVAVNELIINGSVGQDIMIDITENLTLGNQQNAVDLAIIEDLGIVDVTAFLATEWEPRVQMDIAFGTHSTVYDDVGSIETVEITDLDNGETFIVGD